MTSYSNIKHILSAEKVYKGVHWGWWVFWIIVFWPACIFVAISHFKIVYNVVAEDVDGTYIRLKLTGDELEDLKVITKFKLYTVPDSSPEQQKPVSSIIVPDSVKLTQGASEAAENMLFAAYLLTVCLLWFGFVGLLIMIGY
jgi:hypothetical protein